MGLFSTLVSEDGPQTASSTSASSSKVATVLQMYTSTPIQLVDTSALSGFAALSYQAVQVGSRQEEEVKNRHVHPDLGVWNACIHRDNSELVDALMGNVKQVSTFCWTADLREPAQVEPTISALQAALVRHLIEHPPAVSGATVEGEDAEENTATTSLYQLQAIQFGLAAEDKEGHTTTANKNIDESHQDVKTTLMICALMPDEQNEDENAFQTKQARSLLIYHLRKFATALDASLCFVEAPAAVEPMPSSQPPSPSKESKQAPPAPASQPAETSQAQPTVSYDQLTELWRDLALGQCVWNQFASEPSSESPEEGGTLQSPPMYGPGHHHDEVIDSALLRSAHYPGHWDAQTDSVWVALPTDNTTAPETTANLQGDQGWLNLLRGSIVAHAPKAEVAKGAETEEKKPAEKDKAVSSFFESLLKNP